MKQVAKGALALLVLTAGLAGCLGPENMVEEKPATPTDSNSTVIHEGDGGFKQGYSKVTRFVDEEANVVCYKYDEKMNTEYGHAGGLSCLPMNDTDLEQTGEFK